MIEPEQSAPRFVAQDISAKDPLESQTVEPADLKSFRKRRQDVEEQKSGAATPNSEGNDADARPRTKKQKLDGRKLLSFGEDHDQEDVTVPKSKLLPRHMGVDKEDEENGSLQPAVKRKLKPNPNAKVPAIKAVTKASVAAAAAERERLRTEFLKVQESVRNSDIAIPFMFYDGSNVPGGVVKVKKGEHIWLFLERCRKLGAEMGVSSEGSVEGGGSKQRVEGKKSWARIGVDDLMLVRGDIIIPHHYEFYYFIANRIADPSRPDQLLFDYAGTASLKSEAEQPLLPKRKHDKTEGQDDEPSYTKVVDRRWYERNKHIYPASLWREYKTGKEYEELLKGRRDTQGNDFFFA